ncbi:MAG: hypothetical protein KME32_16960 [Mojavia pulchra JT2-VF2]|jgi:hypothetical protein|uniref:Uncharacterized protein n=1 Tax=Mojavia pulchra JT2-VF2 TaxID=287848 RepID=A0A951UGR8_9NOST|nr:hypothetical protein [Mojavia pulchra JT2-VF2]
MRSRQKAMSETSPTGKSYGYAARTPVPLCRGTRPPDWLTALRLRIYCLIELEFFAKAVNKALKFLTPQN